MKIFYICLALTFCSCDMSGYVYIIPEENGEAARAWVLECIGRANPISDEEPEDWIKRCAITVRQLYGRCVKVKDTRRAAFRSSCSPVVKGR